MQTSCEASTSLSDEHFVASGHMRDHKEVVVGHDDEDVYI